MAPALVGLNTKALRKGDAEPPITPGTARIYSMRFCPWAERVTLYAAAKGFPVEVVNVNLGDKPEWYFSKHPEGKVPAFEKDGKFVIESGVIPEYLDGIYPETSILPSDPFEKAQQRLKLEKLSVLPPAFYGLVALIKDPQNAALKEEKTKVIEAAFDTAEKTLDGDYFGGSSAGYSDWMSYPFFERLFLFVGMFEIDSISSEAFPGDRWPKLSAWWSRISVLPAARAVAQPKEAFFEFIDTFVAGKANPDAGL